MMRTVFTLLLAGFAAALLGGCAGDRQDDPNRVSNMPWNRPEKWEGQGALGGFSPNSQ